MPIHTKLLGGALAALVLITVAGPASAYPRPGRNERVSLGSDGSQGAGTSTNGFLGSSLSSTGRYVVFRSPLAGLDRRDTNLTGIDLFWHDRVTGKTELVVLNGFGLQAADHPLKPHDDVGRVSGSGRYVAFHTYSPEVAPYNGVRDTDDYKDVFVKDMFTGKVERISVGYGGKPQVVPPPADGSWNPAISGDGRYVAFQSNASNLVKNDTGGVHHVFVRDRKLDKTELVSVSSSGERADTNVQDSQVSISHNGRWVVFASPATNLVKNDTNGVGDVFVRDLKTNKTERVSVASDESQGSVGSGVNNTGRLAISNDGRRVVFNGGSPEFTPNQKPRSADIYVRDRKTGRTERVSVSSAGEEGDSISFISSISGDGRIVAIASDANNLAPGDTGQRCVGPFFPDTPKACLPSPLGGGDTDVFVHDVRYGATYLASVGFEGTEAMGCPLSGEAFFPTLSNNGKVISFASCSTNLVSKDTNLATDNFVREIGPNMGVGQMSGNSGSSTTGGVGGSSIMAEQDVLGDAAVAGRGAEIIGASLARRDDLHDLFLKIDVDRIPGPRGTPLPSAGDPAVVYGARLTIGSKSYEVRAVKGMGALTGIFGLFDCSSTPCREVAKVRGGYGTVGESIVVAIPSKLVGADGPDARIDNVSAFAALGTYHTGPARVLDQVTL